MDFVQNERFSEGSLKTSDEKSGSLKISPEEQVRFLQNFIDHKLPVSDKAYQMTKNIMFMQELSGGWKLYGKTGNGNLNKIKNLDLQQGWFVGFIHLFACMGVF